MLIDLNLLLEYIDWERQKWHESFGQHGDRVLMSSAGPHSDTRFETVGGFGPAHLFRRKTLCGAAFG
jgi:hypothetical protein